ncbi:MAG: hypothetical protein JSS49_07955 [Planctomycetes bacterium]|nr:hypothetical protein [Planctomycetota bacterium]
MKKRPSTRALQMADDEEPDDSYEEIQAALKIAEHLCVEAHQYTAANACRAINEVCLQYLGEIEVLKFALRLSDALRAVPVCKCGGVILERSQGDGNATSEG